MIRYKESIQSIDNTTRFSTEQIRRNGLIIIQKNNNSISLSKEDNGLSSKETTPELNNKIPSLHYYHNSAHLVV